MELLLGVLVTVAALALTVWAVRRVRQGGVGDRDATELTRDANANRDLWVPPRDSPHGPISPYN